MSFSSSYGILHPNYVKVFTFFDKILSVTALLVIGTLLEMPLRQTLVEMFPLQSVCSVVQSRSSL